MSALYMDGFDHYGAGDVGLNNMLDGSWAQVQPTGSGLGPGVPSWGSRTGFLSLQGGISSATYRYVLLPSAQNEIFLSFGYSVPSLPTANLSNCIVNFCTSGNAVFARLWCQADGSIVLTDASNTVLASSNGPIIVPSNWHFFEMDFNANGGDFTLRVDDPTASNTPLIMATGLSFTSSTVGQLQLISTTSGASSHQWLDDFFVRSTAGTINNSWLGDRQIATLLVDGDTPTAGWTPRYYQNIGSGILNVQGLHNTFEPVVTSPTATSLNIGASDFTLESFVRFAALPSGTNKSTIFSRWDEVGNFRSYQLFLGSVGLNNGSLCFQTSTDGTSSTVQQPIIYPFTPELDTWYNIAVVRSAGELLLYVNGQQLGLPISDTRTYFAGSATFSLGGEVTGAGAFTTEVPGTYLDGWLDELRFTNGVGRYTSNYTPTTTLYPRNSSDPDFSDVVLLCGFDSQIQDESSFARSMVSLNGAFQQVVTDGPLVGVFSTMGKLVPDDFTFAEAPFLPATNILTLNAQPANGDTVTVGTTNGSTAAVYTFQTSLGSNFGDILIDTSLQQTLQNLFNAINAGPGSGTKYGSATTSNHDVEAEQLPAGQMEVTALAPGTIGNSVASTSSLTNGGSWTTSTLTGGTNIPGPSAFKVQRLPAETTLISAVQVSTRSFKSDAGVGSINTALIGPLGGTDTGATHSLTVSPIYYNDIYETDPDTTGPLSPTTIINGSIKINRVT